ncbi:MAG: NADH pyrophosphatase, decaps 5'-NAD modified RNA, partial [uncultured Thermomicrobiales bacterium]
GSRGIARRVDRRLRARGGPATRRPPPRTLVPVPGRRAAGPGTAPRRCRRSPSRRPSRPRCAVARPAVVPRHPRRRPVLGRPPHRRRRDPAARDGLPRPARVARAIAGSRVGGRRARSPTPGLGPRPPLLRPLRHPDRPPPRRARETLPDLRPDRVPPHLPGRDRADRAGRRDPPRPRPPVRRRPLRSRRRVRRGRGEFGGRRPPRDRRRGGNRDRSPPLLRQPALAVPARDHGRLHRRPRRRRDPDPGERTGRGRLVPVGRPAPRPSQALDRPPPDRRLGGGPGGDDWAAV